METIFWLCLQTVLLFIIAVGVVFIAYQLREGDPPDWPFDDKFLASEKNLMPIPPHSEKMKKAMHEAMTTGKMKQGVTVNALMHDVAPPNTPRALSDWKACLLEKMFRRLEFMADSQSKFATLPERLEAIEKRLAEIRDKKV